MSTLNGSKTVNLPICVIIIIIIFLVKLSKVAAIISHLCLRVTAGF